mgnify:CR=1 FL=1
MSQLKASSADRLGCGACQPEGTWGQRARQGRAGLPARLHALCGPSAPGEGASEADCFLILTALPGARIYESLSANAVCAAMLRNITFMMGVRCTRKDLGWVTKFMKENKGGGEEASLR